MSNSAGVSRINFSYGSFYSVVVKVDDWCSEKGELKSMVTT